MSPIITETFWPALRAQLFHPDSTIADCAINCTICYEKVELQNKIAAHESDHTAVVLPCGHILGSSCLRFWSESLLERSTPPSCPSCRITTIHARCRHAATPMEILLEHRRAENVSHVTPHSENVAKSLKTFATAIDGFLDNGTTKETRRQALKRLPPTIPEGGGLSELCDTCYVQDILRTMTAISSIMRGSVSLAPDEFVGVAATLGDGIWLLHSEERRRHATIRRGLNVNRDEMILKACRGTEKVLEEESTKRWFGRDFLGIRFSFHVYAWE
ncbi:hypothetical protein LRP88_09482 [Fusarium phalaenopsidis]